MKRTVAILTIILSVCHVFAQTVDSIPHHHVGYEGLFNSGQFEGILQMRDGNVLFNFLAGIHSKDRKERVGFHAKSSRDFSIVGNVFYKTSRHGGIVLDSIFIPDTDPSEFLMEKNPNGDDHIRVDIVHDSASGGSFLQIFPFDNDFRFDSLNRVFVPLTDTFAYGLVGGFIDEQNDIVFAYNTPYGMDDDDWDFHIARFGLDGTLRHENTIPFSSIPINFSYNGFGIFNESPREYYRLGTNRVNSSSTNLLELVCHVFDTAFEVKDSIFIAESSLSPENPRLKYLFGWMEGLVDDGDDFVICSRFVWRGAHDAVLAHMNSNSLQGVDEENCKLLCFDNHPYEEFLRPGWIRPEDVPLFEPELEIVKLATRTVSAKYTLEIVEAYLNHSYDGNLLRLLNPYHGFEFRPYRIDNKSFPADWITSGIAGKCAENCTHCGKCEQLLKQVMKYDVDPTVRATSYSFGAQFVPRQAQKKPDAPSASGERNPKGGQS